MQVNDSYGMSHTITIGDESRGTISQIQTYDKLTKSKTRSRVQFSKHVTQSI